MSKRKIEDKASVLEEVQRLKDGDPIPIEALKIRVKPDLTAFIELCKSIPAGYAQAIRDMAGSTARDRIKRLIEKGILPPTYRVSVMGSHGAKRVYIIHEKEVKTEKQS